MIICSGLNCQTTAGCICGRGHFISQRNADAYTERDPHRDPVEVAYGQLVHFVGHDAAGALKALIKAMIEDAK